MNDEIRRYELGGVRFLTIGGEVYCRYDDIVGKPAQGGVAASHPSAERPAGPKGEQPYKKPEKPVGSAAHRGPKKCGSCGKPGHTYRTCPGEAAEEDADFGGEMPKPAAISRDAFERAKDMQTEGMTSPTIASEIGVPIIAIGKVLGSDDYQEYLGKL